MSTSSVVSSIAGRLADAALDSKQKLVVAMEIRDSVELHLVTADYQHFVDDVLPIILGLLASTPVSMQADSPENKLRHCLLDVLVRLPTTDVLKPHAADILGKIMKILQSDNEENCVLCMRVIANFHRVYKTLLADQVEPFIAFVIQLFKSIPQLVADLFNAPPAASGIASPAAFNGSPSTGAGTPGLTEIHSAAQGTNSLMPGSQSFKVLAECPIMIVLLYSMHRKLGAQSLPTLMPYVIETLSITAQPQAQEHAAAAAKNEIYTGVSPNIRNRAQYDDFIVSQIKIMSFLAYALRAFPRDLQNYYNLVPTFVVRLLKDCPPELSAARKELLVSMRHILSTDFRTFFISKIDVLLEDRVLIGSGLTAGETLRPLAYSTMADVIHHVRNELSVSQIWKAIKVYAKNMHDTTMATSFQIMSAKLLLNFMERIMTLPDRQEGRQIIIVILKAFVERLTSLNRNYSHFVRKNESHKKLVNALNEPVIHLTPQSNFDLKDARYVFRNLMNFLKTVMFGFKSCNPPPKYQIPQQQWQEAARVFNYDDVTLFRKLFREGLAGMAFFADLGAGTETRVESDVKEEREVVESFATVFIHLDQAVFDEILHFEMELFYQHMLENPALLQVVQLFFGSELTSANFCALTMRFLMKHLPDLGSGDAVGPNVLLRLAKLCFMSVTLFPTTNEPVLLPHIHPMIVQVLKLSTETQDPIMYFHLLRPLFRSIGGGRFDSLYRAVLPLLQALLDRLNKRLDSARRPQEKELYADLCLTLPVRLSLLVPHLSQLMNPLIVALNGPPDLVTQGLRTLELYVDNLTPSYFDPIAAPVLNDIMKALWKHLRPLPASHTLSHTTLRILGKLGGRNRAFLTPPDDLQCIDVMHQNTKILIPFKGLKDPLPIRITPGISHALAVLQNPLINLEHRRQAYNFLTVVLLQFIDTEPMSEDFARLVPLCANATKSNNFSHVKPLPPPTIIDIKERQLASELCEKLLEAVFFATSIDDFRDEARALISNICEHMVLLELGCFSIERRRALREFNLDDHEGKFYVDQRFLQTAIVNALAHYNPDIQESGCEAIRIIFRSGQILCPDFDLYLYPMLRGLFSKFSHSCFEETYYQKAAAVKGLSLMTKELNLSGHWLTKRLVELARTMFFVIKDVSSDAPVKIRDDASDLMCFFIDVCMRKYPPEKGTRPLPMLCGLLAYELESSVPAVRKAARKAVACLSAAVDVPISDILKEVTDVFLKPIFGKPLRALPFPMQVGYIDCVIYCMALPNTFLRFNNKLVRLLEEALALVDADDESLTSAHRTFEYSTSQHLVQLRVVCIQLLALAATSSDYLSTQQPQMRTKILAVFFKTLTSSNKEAVDAAYEGLKSVLTQNNKLPKDLLQNGLRPILVNLSEWKRLTVPGLNALARLIELLTYYFKVEIGHKLLSHLKAWTEPAQLVAVSNSVLETNNTVEISCAILEVMHLLPQAACMFIDDIVALLIYVEGPLRRVQYSPFRVPVAKFLNSHPAESFEYFKSRMADVQYGRLFVSLLDLNVTDKLAQYTKDHIGLICQQILNQELAEQKCVSIFNLIFLINLLKSDSEWLKEQRNVIQSALSTVADLVLTTSALRTTSPLHLEGSMAIAELQQIVGTLIKVNPRDAEIALHALVSTSAVGMELSPVLIDCLYDHVLDNSDLDLKRTYLEKALECVLPKASAPRTSKRVILKHIINPILQLEIEKNGDLSKLIGKAGTNGWLDVVHSEFWVPAAELAGNSHPTIDMFDFELLEMSVLIVKSSPQLVADVRKDLIKFGWSFFNCADIMSKMCGYVLVCYFIAAFDTLPKIAGQIYVALLKTHTSEAKSLVFQCLDTLAPVLTQRISFPQWAKWPRRIFGEDGHIVSHVSTAYMFLVKNPDIFFDHRDLYVPFIVSAMGKLSNMANMSLDVDLAELLVKWETRAQTQAEPNTVASTTPSNSSSPDARNFEISHSQREAVITCLIRCVSANGSNKGFARDSPKGKRVFDTLDQLLSLWSDVDVKLNLFDRALVQADLNEKDSQTAAINALTIVRITLKHRSPTWITSNIHPLTQLLTKSIACNSWEIHEALVSVLDIILSAIPTTVEEKEEEEESGTSFTGVITAACQEHQASNPPAMVWLLLAQSVAKVRPADIDPLLPGAIKAFGRTAKEYVDLITSASNPGGATSTAGEQSSLASQSNQDKQATARVATNGAAANIPSPASSTNPPPAVLLPKLLSLISTRISHLGDQRRIFLSLLAQVIERISDQQLSLLIISIVRGWVFSKTELFPTIKEKAALLHKMLMYEGLKNEELATKYFSIIVDVFENENLFKTELLARLEQPFLVGTAQNLTEIRRKLVQILSNSLDENVLKRLTYVIAEQNWEGLVDRQWLNQALQLIFDSCIPDAELNLEQGLRFAPLNILQASLDTINEETDDKCMSDMVIDSEEVRPALDQFLERRKKFLASTNNISVSAFITPLRELQYSSRDLVHELWQDVFPHLYKSFPAKDRTEMLQALVTLMAKDYHTRQADVRPNVILSLLESIARCEHFPPQLVKYLAFNYNAWHAGICILEKIQAQPLSESQKLAECNLDALAELYAGLEEDDMFYGLWRTRSRFAITNCALSFEQCGMWAQAMQMHETAQIKARSGALPYGESEYALWEDHWILCAEKLQQWDVLTDLAKHEGFNDLLLECGWRVADWIADKDPLEQTVKSLMDVPTPRRQVFETFLCLQEFAQKTETMAQLSKCCDEGIQLCLRKWYGLPKRITGAHIPLLHTFQQFVEFMEASQIYTSLSSTTALNLELKSQELKGVLQTWHERLPNVWDDINIWGDLVTWRQHVFGVINKVYLPLIPTMQQSSNGSGHNSAAYRGYHEIAWIINRFAHVARLHNMPDVCVNLLSKIYTLPNIEIQEAFLKLREQAKCHYQNQNDVSTGLDVISNTNLAFFGAQQKSEFFTIKGMSLARLGADEHANEAFATAVQIDVYLPKAWAEWGRFNDRRYKQHPGDSTHAATAISCYLQAAGLYKNHKSRKLLGRILWLVGQDDPQGLIAAAVKNYHGDTPVWYWITYVPQLLNSLTQREAKFSQQILNKIARSFPQALYFPLRTIRDEFAQLRRKAMQTANRSQSVGRAVNSPALDVPGSPHSTQSPTAREELQPWETVEEIMSTLKTAYPLLALSLETLVDQIFHRFKSDMDEDACRLTTALLNDGLQYMMSRQPVASENARLPPATEASITRFAESVLPKPLKGLFERDFVHSKPDLDTYVRRLRRWRDRLEEKLDARSSRVNLESLASPLSDFHHQKFEDVEVPGQNMELKDNNHHFVKIARFLSNVDVVRDFGSYYRRITIRGTDGSLHPFAVQYPSARYCRREERATQMFKMLNSVLENRKESRSRRLQFTLPIAVPLSIHIRLVRDDAKFISMYRIYEQFCRSREQSPDAPFDYTIAKLRAAHQGGAKPDLSAVKMEIFAGIQSRLVPPTVLRDYFSHLYHSFEDFWLFRKQFAYQHATVCFMTIMLGINNRYPHKFMIHRGSGNVWSTEMFPILPANRATPTFLNGEPVAFRLTPNIQTLMGPTATEGLFAMSIMIIAKSLSDPEFDLGSFLPVFVRDELIAHLNYPPRPNVTEQQMRDVVRVNVDAIVTRAASLCQIGEGNIPVNQTVIDLISMSVDPRNLASTDILWMPYL